ncbi:MAG: hypothetical protein HKN49_06685 [Gammaproteobacteria bacterium]|nr:hypothetical protein [Gammaproteobacteria bacterium]
MASPSLRGEHHVEAISAARPVGPVNIADNTAQPVTTPEALTPRASSEPDETAARGQGDNSELRKRRPGELTEAEQARVAELRARDREVRAHEQAHLAAAGPHARGGASYTFETGPDGRRYAVGGEVQIDTAPVAGDPAATLAKAQKIQRAALAPAEPSAQDRRVAAEASAMAAEARAELAQENSTAAYSEEQVGKFIEVLA